MAADFTSTCASQLLQEAAAQLPPRLADQDYGWEAAAAA
jgi:hypothetical protein